MTLVGDRGATMYGDYVNLYTRAELAQQVELPRAGRYRIIVSAGASRAGDELAEMRVTWDREVIERWRVPARRYREVEIELPLAAGSHRLGLAFTNDYYDPKNPVHGRAAIANECHRLGLEPPLGRVVRILTRDDGRGHLARRGEILLEVQRRERHRVADRVEAVAEVVGRKPARVGTDTEQVHHRAFPLRRVEPPHGHATRRRRQLGHLAPQRIVDPRDERAAFGRRGLLGVARGHLVRATARPQPAQAVQSRRGITERDGQVEFALHDIAAVTVEAVERDELLLRAELGHETVLRHRTGREQQRDESGAEHGEPQGNDRGMTQPTR